MVFLIWELTDEHPIVDLRCSRGRNFAMGTLALSLAYGVFFGNVVLMPLWLQTAHGLHRDLGRAGDGADRPAGDPADAFGRPETCTASTRA